MKASGRSAGTGPSAVAPAGMWGAKRADRTAGRDKVGGAALAGRPIATVISAPSAIAFDFDRVIRHPQASMAFAEVEIVDDRARLLKGTRSEPASELGSGGVYTGVAVAMLAWRNAR